MIKTSNKRELAFWLSMLLDLHYMGFDGAWVKDGDIENFSFEPQEGPGWVKYREDHFIEKIKELTPESERLFSIVNSITELSDIMGYLVAGETGGIEPDFNEPTGELEEFVAEFEGGHVCGHCSDKCEHGGRYE